jgi:signal transduction histidine kinase
VIDVLRPQAGGIALQTDLPETPVQALADATALQRVLNNLIGNALKYTPDDGTVTIAVAPAEDQVTIHVEDTGPGMDPDAVPHLFEPFAQAPDSNGRARTGSGLGLAIAKRLADAMEADLRVDTAPGEGTRFTVTLPR